MWLVNVERVNEYLVPEICMQILFAYVGKAVPVYVQARNMTCATPKNAAVEK